MQILKINNSTRNNGKHTNRSQTSFQHRTHIREWIIKCTYNIHVWIVCASVQIRSVCVLNIIIIIIIMWMTESVENGKHFGDDDSINSKSQSIQFIDISLRFYDFEWKWCASIKRAAAVTTFRSAICSTRYLARAEHTFYTCTACIIHVCFINHYIKIADQSWFVYLMSFGNGFQAINVRNFPNWNPFEMEKSICI